ncbi:hypothetical protein NPIL_121891, partial [Nephila pilipes]
AKQKVVIRSKEFLNVWSEAAYIPVRAVLHIVAQ